MRIKNKDKLELRSKKRIRKVKDDAQKSKG